MPSFATSAFKIFNAEVAEVAEDAEVRAGHPARDAHAGPVGSGMDEQRKECGVVRMSSLGVLGAVSLAWLAGCASNPPPRPMPQPVPQRDHTQRPKPAANTPERQTASQTASQTAANPAPARETPTQDTEPAEPEWYRQGAYEVQGREHRAFAVTAGDVRDARSQAMLLAYEAYPEGAVAAHEAVRQPDGSWRFFVLMAEGS